MFSPRVFEGVLSYSTSHHSSGDNRTHILRFSQFLGISLPYYENLPYDKFIAQRDSISCLLSQDYGELSLVVYRRLWDVVLNWDSYKSYSFHNGSHNLYSIVQAFCDVMIKSKRSEVHDWVLEILKEDRKEKFLIRAFEWGNIAFVERILRKIHSEGDILSRSTLETILMGAHEREKLAKVLELIADLWGPQISLRGTHLSLSLVKSPQTLRGYEKFLGMTSEDLGGFLVSEGAREIRMGFPQPPTDDILPILKEYVDVLKISPRDLLEHFVSKNRIKKEGFEYLIGLSGVSPEEVDNFYERLLLESHPQSEEIFEILLRRRLKSSRNPHISFLHKIYEKNLSFARKLYDFYFKDLIITPEILETFLKGTQPSERFRGLYHPYFLEILAEKSPNFFQENEVRLYELLEEAFDTYKNEKVLRETGYDSWSTDDRLRDSFAFLGRFFKGSLFLTEFMEKLIEKRYLSAFATILEEDLLQGSPLLGIYQEKITETLKEERLKKSELIGLLVRKGLVKAPLEFSERKFYKRRVIDEVNHQGIQVEFIKRRK